MKNYVWFLGSVINDLRCSASTSLFLSIRRPLSAAFAAFTGFELRLTLVKMSFIPATSTTALTAPPAITPVPGDAGINNTSDAQNLVFTTCGMVSFCRFIDTMLCCACVDAFLTASGTDSDFPLPIPTFPRPSPTTTTALNLRFRPPLTTFATLEILTTLSLRGISYVGSSFTRTFLSTFTVVI